MSQPPTFFRLIGSALMAVVGWTPPHTEHERTGETDTPVKTVSTVTMKGSLRKTEWGWWRRPGERVTATHTMETRDSGMRASRRGGMRIGPPRNKESKVGMGGGMFRWKHRADWARRRFILPARGRGLHGPPAGRRIGTREHHRPAPRRDTLLASNRRPQTGAVRSRSPVRPAGRSMGQRRSHR